MLDLRKNSNLLLKKLQKREKVILSFRGKPVATIHPIIENSDWENDSFIQFLSTIKTTTSKNKKKRKITNDEIDSLVYGI